MKLESVTRELGLESGTKVLETEWERSQVELPNGGLFFLGPEFVAKACREAGVADRVEQATVAAGKRINSQPVASALAWHFHYCLFRAAEYPRDLIHEWPSLDDALDGDGRMLYLLVLLSGLPELERFNEAHAVPKEVARETLSDIDRWLGGEEDEPLQPPWGITPHAIGWLINHLKGELYRLGRLQFQFGTSHYEIVAFRNRSSRAVLALSGEGIRYREDGGRVTEGVESGAGAWTARLIVTDQQITGTPILPEGRAHREEVTLNTAEWERVLAPEMPAVYIHMPAGGPMGYEECGESLRRALEFFPRHFPDRPFDAFTCGSWLLDSELQDLLPATSNIVRFQREFYLLPIGLQPRYLYRRIFGSETLDPETAPRDTALRRAVLDIVSSGGTLRPTGGGCFLLPEDFDWGAQVYLRKGLP